METSGDKQNSVEEKQPKLPYRPPHLTSLGQIQAMVQNGCMVGCDGGMMTTSASDS